MRERFSKILKASCLHLIFRQINSQQETSHKIWQGTDYLRIKLELCSAPPENILLCEEFLFHEDFAKLRKLNWTNFFCDMMQKLEYKEWPQWGCGILNKVHNLSDEIFICLSLSAIVSGFN